jgi:hypothetical protein
MAIPGRHAPRDEPESYCRAISCPFYDACWAGYTPTGKIEHPREIAAVNEYVMLRDEIKAGNDALDAVKQMLEGVEGVTDDGIIVRWSTVQGKYDPYKKLEVLLPRGET